MTGGRTPERDKIIWLMVQSGKTLKAVGDEYGLTRERVRQIYAREQRDRGADPHVVRRPEMVRSGGYRRGST
jgi:Sigma-70, region 4